MIQYFLQKTPPYSWASESGVSFRGYFFFQENMYEGQNAIDFLKSHGRDALNLLKDFNGSFSVVMEVGDEVILAADRLRSFPLCYRLDETGFSISDNAVFLKKDGDRKNENAFLEFEESVLWISGEKTLYQNIYNVQAGEYVIFDRKSKAISREFYYRFEYAEELKEKVSETEFWEIYDKVGEEMVRSLNGRTAIVPLSGGADSRMIVDLLKRQNYNDVICFTYGDPKSKEVAISKEVAKDRGYQWYFVPYTKETYRNFVTSGEFYDYAKYATGYTSLLHVQDFYAVKELKEQGVFPDDGVFVPGHSGDMIAGSHITSEFLNDKMIGKEYIDWILKKFYHYSKNPELRKMLLGHFGIEETAEYDASDLLCKAECFNIQERQAKFIVNSVRTYEYFGYEWLIPLWSNTLMDFWSGISKKVRYRRKLYFECLGVDTVKSTNDVTAYSRASAIVHKFKWLTTIMRKVFRIKEYYTHPWHVARCVSFGTYVTRVLKTSELFSLNHIMYDLYLNGLGNRGY